MVAIALIPARLQSSRLPGKAIRRICNIPMIEHVYKRTSLARNIDQVYVATDSELIAKIVSGFGGKFIMTSPSHETGSDRIAEAASNINCDYVVNIQGDEALVNPLFIDKCLTALQQSQGADAVILVNKFYGEASVSDIKVVLNSDSFVMYFSRADIPSFSRFPLDYYLKAYHVVSFTKEFLLKFHSLPRRRLEVVESNEYLRILENGYRIKAVEVKSSAISVDTLNDLRYVRSLMPYDPFFPQYA